MTKLENKVLRIVKANHGISVEAIALLIDKKKQSIKKAIDNLYVLGRVTPYRKKLYPNYRSLVVYEKGKDLEVEEIELKNYLSPTLLNKYIEHSEDDYWYCNNYLINEENKILFEKTNKVVFDLNKFEYFLTYTMDNSEDKF
jgi:hypothetical protein